MMLAHRHAERPLQALSARPECPRAGNAWPGMTGSAEVAPASPPLIVTAHVGAEVHRGIDGTGALVGRRHRLGSLWKRWRGMVGHVCTRGTERLLRQALEGFGFVGAFALELGG